VRQVYEDFSRGKLQSVYVSGAYDQASVPVPRFDLLVGKQRFPLALEATRGCPFSCEFCALTGLGTRHHTRPTELIVRDIREGQRMLRGLVPWHKRRMVLFCDNNIGGNLSYLSELCEALNPLKIRWGSAITFNAIANLQIVKTLSRSGCRLLFVGLESFNPAALADMHKHLNAIDKMRTAIDQCRDHGILIVSGLMISPTVDDGNYIRMIPKHLKESGLHVPSFICFECPIPGTPYFHRLASGATPQFLSNGLLRDFTGYTLVVKPKHETIDNLVDAYKWLLNEVYSKKTRLSKLVDDLRHFISNGHLLPSLIDLVNQSSAEPPLNQARTFLAGSDLPPPEATSVPLTEADFDSDTERRSIMAPWRVTDSDGCVLPEWLASTTIFESKGRVSTSALSLTATA